MNVCCCDLLVCNRMRSQIQSQTNTFVLKDLKFVEGSVADLVPPGVNVVRHCGSEIDSVYVNFVLSV